MTGGAGARVIAEAIRLLAQERELLLAGDYATLARVAETRAEQVDRLAALDPQAAQTLAPALASLRAAALRNGALLKAALEGAAAGRRRLMALRDCESRLASYDASGAPVQHVAPATSQGRRA